MKIPNGLGPLIEEGVIDEVIRPLRSGKEASIYVVRCGADIRCAKVYKDMAQRSFQQRAQYQEGRRVRSSRQARAMGQRTRFGRKAQETAWKTAEVDALNLLTAVGVRVPSPYGFFNGVLLMELIMDEEGQVAPRLGDVDMCREQALEDHALMMQYVMRMLCAGMVHGDLSEFNVLVDEYGPVIIDLPQVVDAAANNNAESMFARDVNKITAYYSLFAPELMSSRYAKEIWVLYEEGELHPDMELSGEFAENLEAADVDSVMEEIRAAMLEELERQERMREAEEPDQP